MDGKQSAKLKMFQKVYQLITLNASALSGIAQIATLNTQLGDLILAIFQAAGYGAADISGTTTSKTNSRNELSNVMLRVSRVSAAYFHSINDQDNRKLADFLNSEVSKFSDNDLYAQASLLYSIANPVKTHFEDFGGEEAWAGELNTKKEAFMALIPSTSLAIEGRSAYNKAISPFEDDGDDILESMDVYMGITEFTNLILFNKYKSARAIDDPATITQPALTSTSTIDANKTNGVDISSISVSGASEAGLSNTGPDGLKMGFSNTPGVLADSPDLLLVVASGYERATFASLGYDAAAGKVYLNILNPGVGGSYTIEVWE